MTNVLEQEESIAFLKKIKVVPQKAYAKILEENGTKFVLRQYKIQEIDGGYNMINISYALNIDTDLVTFYSVYATSDKTDDTICLCISQDNTYNTLFDNILSLEEDVWKYCLTEDGATSYDLDKYKSLIFETDEAAYPLLANAIYEKRTYSALLNRYIEYINVNRIISKKSWKSFLNDLTKLSLV